jgi:hypothetical protein
MNRIIKKIMICIVILCPLTGLAAQTSPFIGTWYGSIADAQGNKIWDIKLNITSTTAAEISLFNNQTSTYVSYLTDPASASYTRSVVFSANGNRASLNVLYKSSEISGQSIYNIVYRADLMELYTIWSDVSTKLTTNELSARVASGKFEKGLSTTYTGSNIVVGAQSFDYISIESIKTSTNYTDVTFKVVNNRSSNISGTFHEPGHATAMRIADLNRQNFYMLKSGVNVTLPYEFVLEPGYELSVTLRFDPMPMDMKSLNILEGAELKSSNWNFYDVHLK